MIGESYGDTTSSLVTGNALNTPTKMERSLPFPSLRIQGKMYYFCTYHDTMIQELLVADTHLDQSCRTGCLVSI